MQSLAKVALVVRILVIMHTAVFMYVMRCNRIDLFVVLSLSVWVLRRVCMVMLADT